MKYKFIFALVLLIPISMVSVIISEGKNNDSKEMNVFKVVQVVDNIDFEKYKGVWYEIARYSNPFQKNCIKNVKAEYRLLKNNEIEVINTCIESNGKVNKVKGLAIIPNPKEQGKLAVSFFDILGWRPIWGDYWILGIDTKYHISIVGDRNKKYGWVLCRDKVLSNSEKKWVTSILDKNGYDSKSLVFTQQD